MVAENIMFSMTQLREYMFSMTQLQRYQHFLRLSYESITFSMTQVAGVLMFSMIGLQKILTFSRPLQRYHVFNNSVAESINVSDVAESINVSTTGHRGVNAFNAQLQRVFSHLMTQLQRVLTLSTTI